MFTLLVFDSRQHALPVAWIITRSFAKPDVSKWLKALIDRARSVEPGWKVNGFLIDDAAADIDLLRQDILLQSKSYLKFIDVYSWSYINCLLLQ